ncbi:hypothetical protein CspeluHIS016_0701830 [Cutaneotrichosporon spelunceum]|uniref:Uncharacterized protein n=1 Tax=Cutaneotrichosporon spelunceum TaxID=1672016 RepID=A0AAD3YEJ3_9TREE|nr:hypothetical protein CspeluHIS016_0701830 [Cutaneotrichosporon spelunceum]
MATPTSETSIPASPASIATPTHSAASRARPPSATLAAMFVSGLGKRKRELTHMDGIPVAMILEGAKAALEREVRTPRRVSLPELAKGTVAHKTDIEMAAEEGGG